MAKIIVQAQETVPVGAVVAISLEARERLTPASVKAAETAKSVAVPTPEAAIKVPAGKVKITIIGGYPAAIRRPAWGQSDHH